MPSIRYFSQYFLMSCLIGSMTACDDSNNQKTRFFEEGKLLFKEGYYQKARQAFDKVAAIAGNQVEERYQLADQLSQLGDVQDAIKQYQAILKQTPDHIMARIKLGQIALLTTRVDEAEKMANEALNIDSTNAEAQILLAGVLAAKNNSDAAFMKVESVLQSHPDDVGAISLKASLFAKTGKLDKAIELLLNYGKQHPDNVATRLLLANFYGQQHELEKAQALLEAIVKIEPKVIEHRKRLAVFLIANKQLEKAETVLRVATAELPDSESAKTLLIEFLANQRSPETAIAELLPMLEQNTGYYDLRFQLAQLQSNLKQTDKAEATLQEIISMDKQGLQVTKARNQLARLYMLTGRTEQAKTLIQNLLQDNPNDIATLTLRGEMALAAKRLPEAIADFRTALGEQPQNLALLKLLSAAHLANNDRILARENMEKVVTLAPTDEVARLDLVNLLLQIGDKEQASQQLNALFKINPNSRNGLEALFKIYAAQKQWEQATQIAAQLEKVYPDDATGYYLSGIAYQASEKWESSNGRFEQALQKQPQAAEPLAQLIKNYLTLKQSDKALAKLNEILKNQPGNFFAYNLVGDVNKVINKYADAITAYQQAIEIKPNWIVPYRNIAALETQQKHKSEAIEILNKGIAKMGESAELITDLAALYHLDGEHQKVIELYEKMYQKNPDSLPLVNNLARYLADYGNNTDNLDRAAKLAEPLAQTDNPYLLDTVAWIAYKQGDYEKALKNLLKANELNPDMAAGHYHLGMVYLKQGNKTAAKEHLQKAINKKEPFDGLTEAKAALEELEK